MLQPNESDFQQQDILTIENNLHVQQTSLINMPSDWTGAIPQQGTSLSEEFSFSTLPYNYPPLPGSFPDSSCNMGYQYSGNQYNTSACCLLDPSKRQIDSIPPQLLNELESAPFVKDLIDSYSKTGNASNDGVALAQSHNLYNPSYPPQEALHFPQYNTNSASNCNLCGEVECTDKIYSPSKQSNFSSCLLDQNPIDIESIEPDDVPQDSNDLSSDFTPLIEAVNERLMRNRDSDNESDIVVEDSDNESEISIDVGPYIEEKEIDVTVMRCFVCNLNYSDRYGSNFAQVNSSFPLTFISQTPVMLKLIEIIPTDLQPSVKFENNLICRRCLNLIDTIESLEARLVSVKKTICDFVCHSSKDGIEELNVFQESNVIDENPNDNIAKELPSTENDRSTKSPDIVEKGTVMVNTGVNTDATEDPSKSSNPPKQLSENLAIVNVAAEEYVHKRYQCERCGKMYKREKQLTVHLRRHNEPFKEKCQECGKGFMKKSNLEVHMRTHWKWSCVGCRASFKTEDELMEHLGKCADTKFPCEKCSRVLSSQETYKAHLEKHVTQLRVCKICSKGFKHPSNLEAHMKSHTNIKPFSCEKCGRTYKNLSHLRRHQKSHSMSHHCSICQGKFATEGELEIHLSTHPDRVICDECEKSFVSKAKMLEHKKIHSGTQTRKQCPFCKKMIVSNFKAHVMSHDENNAFICEICDMDFSFKQSLMKHIKLKHSGNVT